MTLSRLIPDSRRPGAAEPPSAEQRAASSIDASLRKLAHTCAVAIRTVGTRRLYHDAEALRAAAFGDDHSPEQLAEITALEPLLAELAGDELVRQDTRRLNEAAARFDRAADPIERAKAVAGTLDVFERVELPTDLMAAVAALTQPLLRQHGRSIEADGRTVRNAVERVVGEGLETREQAVRVGQRLGWSNVAPLLAESQRWALLASLASEHLPDDPGDPPDEPAEPVADDGGGFGSNDR